MEDIDTRIDRGETVPSRLIIIKQRYTTDPLKRRVYVKARLRNRLGEPDHEDSTYDFVKDLKKHVEAVVEARWENDAAFDFEIGEAWHDEFDAYTSTIIDMVCDRAGWNGVDVTVVWQDKDGEPARDSDVIQVGTSDLVDDIEDVVAEWSGQSR